MTASSLGKGGQQVLKTQGRDDNTPGKGILQFKGQIEAAADDHGHDGDEQGVKPDALYRETVGDTDHDRTAEKQEGHQRGDKSGVAI